MSYRFLFELASVLLESVCVLVLVSVLVALESDPFIVDNDDAGATRWFVFCLLIVLLSRLIPVKEVTIIPKRLAL